MKLPKWIPKDFGPNDTDRMSWLVISLVAFCQRHKVEFEAGEGGEVIVHMGERTLPVGVWCEDAEAALRQVGSWLEDDLADDPFIGPE